MRATGFTHVSVGARDLEESARFYKGLFGMEEIPSPDFPSEVVWLRVGDLQLHLFETDETAPIRYHFGVEVDDFGAAYNRAGEMGVRIEDGYFSGLRELPDGAVQMYVRDPAGNTVEVNWPDAGTLDKAAVGELKKIGGTPEATLYTRPSGVGDGREGGGSSRG